MGITIYFDPAFDGEVWPGPLGDGSRAKAGELWVGPLGLLARLEVELGLGALHATDDERAVALASKLNDVAGFWSESAKVDAIGCARRILWEREQLALGGWDDAPVSERHAQIAKLAQLAPPGRADRLRAVVRSLERRGTQVTELRLYTALEELPLLWRNVLHALEKSGASLSRVREVSAETADVTSDLAASRNACFSPQGDGSLVLFRPIGPLAAAEEVAAWLASLQAEERKRTVIIGADSTLDQALTRHGLPTTSEVGTASAPYGSALLEALPLCLQLAITPQDPALAYALLTLPMSPVPKGVARKLIDALDREPSLQSDSWQKALSAGLEAIENEKRRARVAERLTVIFGHSAIGVDEPYPTAEAIRRAGAVQSWAQARGSALLAAEEHGEAGDGDVARRKAFEGVVLQALRFKELAALHQGAELSQPDLERLSRLATDFATAKRFERRAGIFAVSTPAAVVAHAKNIVWWDFGRHTVRQTRRMMLKADERDALQAHGVELPEPSKDALFEASGWRRAHRAASERLIAVAPERGADGERFFVHPLWDELVGAANSGAESLEQRSLRPSGYTGSPRAAERQPLPVAAESFQVAPKLPRLRDEHSPSSLGRLLGCSLQYALHHQARLRDSMVTPPQDKGPLQAGRIAHHVFERVFEGSALPTPDEAYTLAEHAFDSLLPRIAASYVMAGSERERGELRLAIAESAKVLADLLKRAQASANAPLVLSSEREIATETKIGRVRGRPDLLIEAAGSPIAVVDFKYGGRDKRRLELEKGVAVQLASYATASEGSEPPALSYLIIRDRVVLSSDTRRLPGAALAQGPDAAEVWRATEMAFERRAEELRAGKVVAPANGEDFDANEKDRTLDDGSVHLMPACRYCDYRVICGQGLGPLDRSAP